MKILIVGRGILGLSIAEYLSRDTHCEVMVVSSAAHSPASAAAAANLATKAQVFARDPHFDLKIRGKLRYSGWLDDLRSECNQSGAPDLPAVYKSGFGRDFFSDEAACAVQLKRVQQPACEIETRGLPEQKLRRSSPTTIDYGDEGWVDAQYLLSLLEKVCALRGVAFSEFDVINPDGRFFETSAFDHLILAAGSYTPRILAAWGAQGSEEVFRKTRRWSHGGTLEILSPDWSMPDELSLIEVVPASGPVGKVTFSGASGRLFCSSVSVKCQDSGFSSEPGQADLSMIEEQKQKILSLAVEFFGLNGEAASVRFRSGLRLGFGHSELICESISIPAILKGKVFHSLIVAAGAHKSGFLFAPCIGELVLQKMQALQPAIRDIMRRS
jgi:glycine/D-amino acid oxidase-like deaminating enzyme